MLAVIRLVMLLIVNILIIGSMSKQPSAMDLAIVSLLMVIFITDSYPDKFSLTKKGFLSLHFEYIQYVIHEI